MKEIHDDALARMVKFDPSNVQTPRRPVRVTHWLPSFTNNGPGGTQLAFCGAWIDPKQHSAEPSCPRCRRMLLEDEAELDALRNEVWTDKPVAHRDVDPTRD